MIYYRVREKYDQTPVNPKVMGEGILIANELYTEHERNSMPKISDNAFERVEIPESRTYWCFGARFAMNLGGT